MIKVIWLEQEFEHAWLNLFDEINNFLAIVFVVLQAILVFWYPRLNVNCHKLLNWFGMLHLVAVNIIMWFRTLIKESIHEIIMNKHGHNLTQQVF